MIFLFLTNVLRIPPRVIFSDVTPALWLVKLAGALAGSLISIAYVLPRGRREAFLRLGVGVATGMVFGGTVGVKIVDLLGLLDKISLVETSLVGAAFASLCAWWGLGALRRVAETWGLRHLGEKLTGTTKDKDSAP